MRKLLAIIVAVLCVSAAAHAQDGGPFAFVGAGDRVPEFKVATTDGTTIDSHSLEGRVTLITLWASWCPSCRKEFKRLAKDELFGELLQNKEFCFLPISREEQSATVVAWMAKMNYPFTSAIDADRSVYGLFASEEIPRNIVVGPDGTILHHSSGGSKKELQKVIALCREQVALLEAQQTSK
jgi:peroxiredoxin